MLFKLLILLLFICAVLSLGSGMFFLVRDQGKATNAVKALSIRIGICVGIFVLLFIGWATGFIAPHPL